GPARIESARLAAAEPRAEGKTAHERGQHRADSARRVSHREREQPQPDDFVDERGGAGREIQNEKHAAVAHLTPHYAVVWSPRWKFKGRIAKFEAEDRGDEKSLWCPGTRRLVRDRWRGARARCGHAA